MSLFSALSDTYQNSIPKQFANGLLSLGLNQWSSSINAKRAWKYAQRAMALQDQYNRNFVRDYYGISRQGLEKAGYNPLLALGSSGVSGESLSPTMMNTESSGGSNAVNSAQQAAQLASNMELQSSQSQSNSAQANLAEEQAKTEQAKRVQMDFQNAMLDVEKHLKQKDLDTYDKRFYTNIYEQMQRAENYKAQSAIGMMNAQTNARNAQTAFMNYQVNSRNADIIRYNAETNRYKRSTSMFGISLSGYSKDNFSQPYRSDVRSDSYSEHGYWY